MGVFDSSSSSAEGAVATVLRGVCTASSDATENSVLPMATDGMTTDSEDQTV